MEIDFRLALYALGAAGTLLLLLRFGKIIARYAIIFGALAVAGVLGLALYEHSRAARQAVQAATVAATGVSVMALVLAGLLLVTAGCAGYFYLRWKLAERRPPALYGRPAGSPLEASGFTWLPGPDARWRRRQPQPPPTVYVVQTEDETSASSVEPDDDDGVDSALAVLRDLDLSKWGW